MTPRNRTEQEVAAYIAELRRDCAALRRDLDDELSRREQERERQEAADREARRERERSYTQVSDWPTAFQRQRVLLRRELDAVLHDERLYGDVDDQNRQWWEEAIRQAQRAAELWRTGQEEIARAEAALRERIAVQLEAEFPAQSDLPECLRANDPARWLNW